MRKKLTSILCGTIAASCSLMFTSCEKESEDLTGIEVGKNYMPLQVGKYILYDVDSIIYDDFLKAEIHNRYQMRYTVADSFSDNEGRISYTVDVHIRKTSADKFEPNDVIYYTPTDSKVEMVQNNLRFIKLTFPVADGNSWNGNTYLNSLNTALEEYNNYSWNYTYSRAGVIFDPGNNPFQTTVTVNQIDDVVNEPDGEDYASKNFGQEIYAYNVGMIFKERIYWVYQPTIGYRKGYAVTMRAIENN